MTDMGRLSERVYEGLCHKIGTRKEVSERREISDIAEAIINKTDLLSGEMQMLSGSYREGFRLSGLDQDRMIWPRDIKVIFDLSQAQQYRQPGAELFLSKGVDSRPGFVLLQTLTESNNNRVLLSCVSVNDVSYISSSLYRKQSLKRYKKGWKEHGPCVNIVTTHNEYDEAYCFSCDFWPPLAASWMQRCHSWPSPPVLYEIIVSGCHFMAVGSKGSPNEDKEWRLSFSQAEQKLVYAMNHCQFIVYGLLKLFLKEVINEIDKEKLLCSYFLKTAVFWEIQENNISCWCPQNILLCFWACYKRVIKWVYTGYCPNFFVTENNMFIGKISGCSQSTLFDNLHKLYEKGISCLLHCKSIRSNLINTLCHQTNNPSVNERRSSTVQHAGGIMWDILSFGVGMCLDTAKLVRCFLKIKDLLKKYHTKLQFLFLRISAITCMKNYAFIAQQIYISGNRTMYNADMSICKLLKTVVMSGFVSNILFLAMYYYSTFRYSKALSVLRKAETKFSQHNLTYKGDLEKDIVDIGGQCVLIVWKIYISRYEYLHNGLIYVNQLTLEQKISNGNGLKILTFPPLVLFRMLYVLCYTHVNTDRRQEALNDLYILVHHGTYIPNHLRDISYQILGICQEMCGDFHAAVDSFNLSLGCRPFNKIREASLIRIQHAFSKLRNM